MSTSDRNDCLRDVIRRCDRVVDAVLERGYDDIPEDCDDYSHLIQTFEFRKLVTYELYEAYFPPRRHEFEFQILSDLVDVVATSKTAAFLTGSVMGGIVGNASYDLLKKALAYIVRKLLPVKRSHDAFEEVEATLDRIRSYFEKRDNVPADRLNRDLGLEPRKVEPLLKLLGFRYHHKRKRRMWSKPATWERTK